MFRNDSLVGKAARRRGRIEGFKPPSLESCEDEV